MATASSDDQLLSLLLVAYQAIKNDKINTTRVLEVDMSALMKCIVDQLQAHPRNLCQLILDKDNMMLDLWFTIETENWLFGSARQDKFKVIMHERGLCEFADRTWRNLRICVLKSLVLYLLADTLNLSSGDSAPQTIPKDQTKTNNKQIFRRLVEICRSNDGFLPSSCSRGPPPGRTPLPCGQISGLFPTGTRCKDATVWLKLCQEEDGADVVSNVPTFFLGYLLTVSFLWFFP